MSTFDDDHVVRALTVTRQSQEENAPVTANVSRLSQKQSPSSASDVPAPGKGIFSMGTEYRTKIEFEPGNGYTKEDWGYR
jgi:hypothetical protein